MTAQMQKLQYLKKLKHDRDEGEKKIQRAAQLTSKHYQELEGSGGEIIFLSKESMNQSLHDDFDRANATLREAEKRLFQFKKKLGKVQAEVSKFVAEAQFRTAYFSTIISGLQSAEHNLLEAKEEFFEAKILHVYLRSDHHKFLEPHQLPMCDFDSYAGALSDVTGELLRKARLCLIGADGNCEKKVRQYYEDAKIIYLVLSSFTFSNKSGIRSKMEALKNNILKFEEILMDVRTASNRGAFREIAPAASKTV